MSVFRGNVPAYVRVYNSLYSDIMNNVYLEEDRLPNENALAEKYGVSRNTLRQALAVLCEDGLIVKSQGKDTTVAKRDQELHHGKIVNPMICMCQKKIDEIENHYNYGPPTNIGKAKLGLDNSGIVLANTSIYKSGDTIVGYSFMQIPTTAFQDMDVDLTEPSSLEELVVKKIFDAAAKCLIDIKLIYANEMESETLKIKEGMPLQLIESILYNNVHQAFARCKFYFIAEYYKLHFQI